jgi:hypothetical protein
VEVGFRFRVEVVFRFKVLGCRQHFFHVRSEIITCFWCSLCCCLLLVFIVLGLVFVLLVHNQLRYIVSNVHHAFEGVFCVVEVHCVLTS